MTKRREFSIEEFSKLTNRKIQKVPSSGYGSTATKLYRITIRKNGMKMTVHSDGLVNIVRDDYNLNVLDMIFTGSYTFNYVPLINSDIKDNIKSLKRRVEALEYFEDLLRRSWV